MSNNKQIEKPLELPHQETIVGTNTIQTKPFDNQKTMSNNKQTAAQIILFLMIVTLIVWAFKNDKFKPKEHRVTDTTIYWNGEKLINESP